ncbi:MAG: ATP-binding protein [Mycobacteriales bacterium]
MKGSRGRRRPLPLAAWAGLLSGAAVLATGGTTAAVLWRGGRLDGPVAGAVAAGSVAGLVLVLVSVAGALRVAAALRELGADATTRQRAPSVPGTPSAGRVVASTLELAECAKLLDALQLRVRVADHLGERHRREAQTAGAGVSELLSGLVDAEEGARGQLAAELHDTVAQSLMIARGLLAGGLSSPEELARLTDCVEDAEEQVRAVMARTRPPALRDGDLASAVGDVRADLQARYGLIVQVDWPAAPYPLPLASAVTLYRFFQEALLNVVKHADVDDAFLRLSVDEESVVATVRDEGPGFDPSAVRPDRGRHVGLGLLRERARLSGGSLEVESGPAGGTSLQLRLPRVTQVVPDVPDVP